MNILWIKAGGLVPLDAGGKIRSYHILRELSHEHDVTLFTFYAGHSNGEHSEVREMLTKVVCVPLNLPPSRSLRGLADYVVHSFSSHPYTMAKYYRPEVFHSFARLLESETYDLRICDFVYPAPLIPWDEPTPKILFAHNVEAQVWKRYHDVTRNPFLSLVTWREYHALAKAEKFYVQQADHLLTVSELDRRFFSQYIDAYKITVIPTGVDTDYFQPTHGEENPNSLVFTGSLDWLPNDDAMSYFLTELLPRIRYYVPQATFCIAGRNPSPKIRALAIRHGVQVTGRVQDIRPYIRSAAVYVVPLRIGGGTRLKIFEAMAMGKAIISTSIGAEGLPVENGENIIVRDDPDQFALSAARLLLDSEYRRRLGSAARQLVSTNYSWKVAAAKFDMVLRKVVTKRAESLAISEKTRRLHVP